LRETEFFVSALKIDNEILESVPKTMKAKVQLLLKKMKSSPDISWNEKEELKYKGETVQESNVVASWSQPLF
jgi:D-ribose pyranose/furanose isomerase RbsD